MTVTCDVPPSAAAALRGVRDAIGTKLADLATQRDTVLSDFAVMQSSSNAVTNEKIGDTVGNGILTLFSNNTGGLNNLAQFQHKPLRSATTTFTWVSGGIGYQMVFDDDGNPSGTGGIPANCTINFQTGIVYLDLTGDPPDPLPDADILVSYQYWGALAYGDDLIERIVGESRRSDISSVSDYHNAIDVPSTSAEDQLSALGLNMVEGRGVNASGNNLVALKHLWRLTGKDRTLFDTILAKEEGSFVLGISYDEHSTSNISVGCGIVQVLVSDTEVVAGIDVNLRSLVSSGIDPSDIYVYVFWIGDASGGSNVNIRMESLGLTGQDAGLLVVSAREPDMSGNLPAVENASSSQFNLVTSVIIADPAILDDVGQNYPGGPLDEGEVDSLLSPNRAMNGISATFDGQTWTETALRAADRRTDYRMLGNTRVAIPSPARMIFVNTDLGETTGFSASINSCRIEEVDDLLSSLLDFFEMAFDMLQTCKDLLSEGIDIVLGAIESKIRDVLSLIGQGDMAISLMCLVGIPFSIDLGFLDDMTQFANSLSEQLNIPMYGLILLLNGMTIPLCIIQELIASLYPPAGCVGLDFHDLALELELPDCMNDIISQFNGMIAFLQSMIERVRGEVSALLSYAASLLPRAVLSYSSAVSNCVIPETLVFAVAYAALTAV